MTKSKMWLLTAAGCLAFAGFANAELPKTTPDNDGVYTYEYEGLKADTAYAVLVTEGFSEADEAPTITRDGVLYYNVFFSDADGVLPITFVPRFYADATVYIGAGDLGKPIAAFYAEAGEAAGIAKYELTFKEGIDTFTVLGEGKDSRIEYVLKAYDAFGYETELPWDIDISLDDNSDGYIRLLTGESVLELDGMAQPGEYTITVSGGGAESSLGFIVRRDAVPTTLRYVVYNGEEGEETDYSNYPIFGYTGVDGIDYSPAFLKVEPILFDQYGEMMEAEYDFSYVRTNTSDPVKQEIPYYTGTSCVFIPPEQPTVGKRFEYDFIITSKTEPSLTTGFTVTVLGRTEYADRSLSLFEDYTKAKEYTDKLDRGAIVIAADGRQVPTTKQWVKQDVADAFTTCMADTREMLIRAIEKDPETGKPLVTDDQLEKQSERLKNTLYAFTRALLSGSYSRITSLGFDTAHVYIPVGTSKTTAANVTPERPSERPVYSSADTSVATVNAETGAVSAKNLGETIITVSDIHDSIHASYTVTVYKPVSSIRPCAATVETNVGTTLSELFTFEPSDHSDAFTYTSSDTKVASIGKTTGIISVGGAGTTKITVSGRSGVSASVTLRASVPSFALTSTAAPRGSTAKLRLEVSSLVNAANAVVRLYYDGDALTAGEVTPADGVCTVEKITREDGYLEITLKDMQKNAPFEGRLLDIAFAVAEDAPEDSYDVELDITCTDADGKTMKSDVTADGAVSLHDTIPGDATADGTVNGADLLRVAKYVAGLDVDIHTENADLDGDGSVTKDDLVWLARFFAGFGTNEEIEREDK